MTINFFSEEWDAVKKALEDAIEKNRGALERAETEREVALAQGALRALRSILDLPNRKQPQQ